MSGETKNNLFWLAVLILIMGWFFGLGCGHATCRSADRDKVPQGELVSCKHGRYKTCLGWKPKAGSAIIEVKTCP